LILFAVLQYNGLKNGLDEDGNVRAEKPEEIEQLSDWCKPGGPKSRENCIKVLLDHGCPVNEKDYHDFTALHYAAIWGESGFLLVLLSTL
jgi:ankyrin repeat protein